MLGHNAATDYTVAISVVKIPTKQSNVLVLVLSYSRNQEEKESWCGHNQGEGGREVGWSW